MVEVSRQHSFGFGLVFEQCEVASILAPVAHSVAAIF